MFGLFLCVAHTHVLPATGYLVHVYTRSVPFWGLFCVSFFVLLHVLSWLWSADSLLPPRAPMVGAIDGVKVM